MSVSYDFMEWGVRMPGNDDRTRAGSRELCKALIAGVRKEEFIGMLWAAVKKADGVVRYRKAERFFEGK